MVMNGVISVMVSLKERGEGRTRVEESWLPEMGAVAMGRVGPSVRGAVGRGGGGGGPLPVLVMAREGGRDRCLITWRGFSFACREIQREEVHIAAAASSITWGSW